MIDLPIDAAIPEIVTAVRSRRALVVVAPPGSGKTTRVPVGLVKSGLLSSDHPALMLLQPRRVAARAAAARIAEENEWTVGREVGYQIRFERRIRPETRIRVVTEGILTRQLLADPFLAGIGVVVLDEFHERSLHSDLALALLREVRESLREDLAIVVMSATLDAEPIARFLGDCPVVRVQARAHPVSIDYLPPHPREPLHARATRALSTLLGREDPGGHVLVFLPGMEEIRRTARAVDSLAERADLDVLPLHGSLSSAEQDRAIRPSARRKLILSTNVAETSLTIEGVRTVIDTGVARIAEYDPQRGVDRLELRRISRASAAQRAGRAGRNGPGRCLRLWALREERGMPEFDAPEIARVDLCATVLALHSWGQTDPSRFGWFEAPPEASLAGAERLLTWLGALGSNRRITRRGERLLDLPVHPRLGCLLEAAARGGRLREGAAIAALISEKDLLAPASFEAGRQAPAVSLRSRSDLLARMDLLEDTERSGFPAALRSQGIDPSAARRIVRLRDDLVRAARGLTRTQPERGSRRTPVRDRDDSDLLRYLLVAYPDRVCRRRARGSARAIMVGGRGVLIDDVSTVRDDEYFLALDPREDRRAALGDLRVRLASAIERGWLDSVYPNAIQRSQSVEFEDASGQVVALSRTSYHDLLLEENRLGRAELSQAESVLAGVLRTRAESFLREDEHASRWLDRLAFLRAAMPELGLPEWNAAELADVMELACAGCRSLDEVRRLPLVPLLEMRLGRPGAQSLHVHAPEFLTVPSGNRLRLTYQVDRPPILAARLQELFGWTESPRVAGGRVAVLLHILGPNFRPVQVTDDLRSFWSTTYHQVRKDLRARYPKHAWPEDPWTARAEAKGRTGTPGR